MLAFLAAMTVAAQAACSASAPSEAGPLGPDTPVPAPMTSTPSLRSLYVSSSGSDESPGTRDEPFASIRKAASAATPGTTVFVGDGEYTRSFRTRASGTADARIAYVSENKWGARLVGDGDEDEDAVWRNDGDYVDIRGFDISGTTTDGLIETGSYVRILDNRIHGFRDGTCVSTYKLNYTLRDIDIIGNVVSGCGSSSLDHGIYPGHPGGTISNNISYGHAGYGIHCWHNCNGLVITNNLVFDNQEGGILIGQGDGPNYGKVDADDFIVANNIVVDNGKDGIEESGATGSNIRYLNNNVFGNGTDFDLNTGSQSGTITTEPGFVDYRADGSGDYRLLESSPNIDAGIGAGAPPTDIDGTPRPQGGQVDIGVYER
ncbi:right-handed parallel beta-helix repeat-containing protein [Pseudonocardia sp. H11422]|uniref:right-handed parallel beta-helix repeat-containing protein n=1 Tax=Pseudonocardia sp. H11422 TaxID=2835866 RepID=UPI001BDCF6BA|nr:right-handed parallel beta-helix repeat-containing protein [Pseudonocardia sp. H11422]